MLEDTRSRQGSTRSGVPPVRGRRRGTASALAVAALAGGMALATAGPASAVTPTSIKPGGLSRFCAAVNGHMIGNIACVLPNGVTVVCSPISKKCNITNLETATPPATTGPAALPTVPAPSSR